MSTSTLNWNGTVENRRKYLREFSFSVFRNTEKSEFLAIQLNQNKDFQIFVRSDKTFTFIQILMKQYVFILSV